MDSIFQICCNIIRYLSDIFGITYEELNTYLFIYIEPLLVMISFAIVIGIIITKLLKKASILTFLLLAFFGIGGLVYMAATLFVWKRYSVLSAHDTCVMAYNDLETLGKTTGMCYVGINLFLFIILFLTIFGFNMISAFLIKKHVIPN